MDYFFDEQIVEEVDELAEFKKLAHTFIINRNYESFEIYIYELENVKSHRLSLADKFYMEVDKISDRFFISMGNKRRQLKDWRRCCHS